MKTTELDGIDLAFRPKSYFWPLGLEQHLLARIKGAERKAALQRLLDMGRMDLLPGFLAESKLGEGERQAWGRMHPAFMGGEYLPDLLPTEVMVASITIASTTQDVTSVYARRCKNRIHYRVVDEYGGDTLTGRTQRTSIRPLTLGELESFFVGAWPILGALEGNFGDSGYDEDQMQAFVVGVDSQFYPDLDGLYRRRIADFAAVHRGADAEDEEDESETGSFGADHSPAQS